MLDQCFTYKALEDAEKEGLQVEVNERVKSAVLWVSVAAMMLVTLGAAVLLLTPLGGWGVGVPVLRESRGNAMLYSTRGESAYSAATDTVVSCYYNMPDRNDSKPLLPSDLHPHLCTHINVAFARVEQKQIKLDEFQYKILSEVVKLKKDNPKLKILLSVGGASNDNGFSDMVVDHASRKVFIKSIKSILRNYTLDGIDLDWEFPAVHGVRQKLGKRERQHFSQLLREIRAEYIREKREYFLTVAVAAPESIVDASYDVDQLNLYVDYVNMMTYDFHYFSKFTPFTGLNAPLYARPQEQLYMATLNMNYTVHMYMSKGLDANKIVVGIPTYGHSFTLVNSNNAVIGSPASSFGSLGALGFVSYPDVCLYLKKYGNDVAIVQDQTAKVPYLHRQQEWVSYDTSMSVMAKAEFVKKHALRGAMIYSLNADDYEGVCGTEIGTSVKFPLSQSIRNTLVGIDTQVQKRKEHSVHLNLRI